MYLGHCEKYEKTHCDLNVSSSRHPAIERLIEMKLKLTAIIDIEGTTCWRETQKTEDKDCSNHSSHVVRSESAQLLKLYETLQGNKHWSATFSIHVSCHSSDS